MKKIIMIWGILFIFNGSLFADKIPVKKEESENSKPLELPNFVIERVEQLNVTVGKKQLPIAPEPLTVAQLDSLNSFEKQQVVPIASEKFPDKILNNYFSSGFVKGSFGRFTTADVEAAYGVNKYGYELYTNAGFQSAAGHITDADFKKGFLKISSDYIAPMKYMFFGGSRTRAQLLFNGAGYNCYGSKDADFIENGSYNRSAYNFDLSVQSEGEYKGVSFKTGAGFRTLRLNSDNDKANENAVTAYLKLHNYWKKFLLAANLKLDLQSVSSAPANFAQADVSGKYFDDKISIKATAGLQYAKSTMLNDRGGLLLAGDIEYRLNKNFTLFTKVKTGLNSKPYSAFFNENPYIDYKTIIDFAYDIIKLDLFAYFHPTEKMAVSIGGGYNAIDRMPFYTDKTDGTFMVNYDQAKGINFETESWIAISPKDKITANIKTAFYTFNDGKSVPYIPNFKLSTKYERTITDDFIGNIGLAIIGPCYSDIANTTKINAYTDLSLGLEYRFMKTFSMYINSSNLLNQNIYIWNGYKERSLFFNCGLIWQF
jgi:hypothetical protein